MRKTLLAAKHLVQSSALVTVYKINRIDGDTALCAINLSQQNIDELVGGGNEGLRTGTCT